MDTKIDAATGVIGLFGHPVEHSLSPLIMNHAIRSLDINARYLAFDVSKKDLKRAVEGVRALRFLGINVTIPHKTSVIRHLNRLEDDAGRIGAVNCIYREKDLLIGSNTDHAGFITPLRNRKISLKRREALLLGCGGAARAVAYSLLKEGVARINIVNRTGKNAAGFIDWCRTRFPESELLYIGDSRSLTKSVARGCRIVVNTTPVGMFPSEGECPLPRRIEIDEDQVVYDLIYNPAETALLRRARLSGASAINGLEMLVWQAILSLLRWFPDKREKILLLDSSILDFVKSSPG